MLIGFWSLLQKVLFLLLAFSALAFGQDDTYPQEGINNVTLVGTVPEARRHGYGAALTALADIDPIFDPAFFNPTFFSK